MALQTILLPLKSAYMEVRCLNLLTLINNEITMSQINTAVFFYFTESRFPSQVNASTIRFPSILEDTRPGFFGNAAVHVTWEKPSGKNTYTYIQDNTGPQTTNYFTNSSVGFVIVHSYTLAMNVCSVNNTLSEIKANRKVMRDMALNYNSG